MATPKASVDLENLTPRDLSTYNGPLWLLNRRRVILSHHSPSDAEATLTVHPYEIESLHRKIALSARFQNLWRTGAVRVAAEYEMLEAESEEFKQKAREAMDTETAQVSHISAITVEAMAAKHDLSVSEFVFTEAPPKGD